MDNLPDLQTLVADWLEANRKHLPLNSQAWKLSFFPPPPVRIKQPLLLGKYKTGNLNAGFFYKLISKIS